MCRLLGYCADRDASLADLIGDDGLREFTGLCALHGDGWGMAWYEGDEPVVRKSAARADSEPEYDKLAREPLADLGLVHLRWATPGLGLSEADTHPFRYGQWAFAHNGAIHPQDRLGQLLPPGWAGQPAGSTDSERYFLLIMSKLASRGGDVVAAIADAAADAEARFEPNSLNAILLSPDALYAISWHHRSRVPAAKLRACGYDQPEQIAAYFDLAYRAGAGAVAVASSGWPQPGWTPLPNRHVLVAERRTLAAEVVPLHQLR